MPLKLAQEVAALIQNDPVMARQIKEHIKPDELANLLEIIPNPELAEEFPVPAALSEAVKDYENGEILEFIVTRYTRAEILEAFRLAKR